MITAWLAAFCIVVWAAFLLKVSTTFSRIETAGFFFAGGFALVVVNVGLAHLLGRHLASGRISLRHCFVVLLGPHYDLT
ncbi:hypothetical protein J8J40_28250, partial [Mycobacterium tuberculosis]|nr:hypothetical protein [Mycobacterium tuberculosis]